MPYLENDDGMFARIAEEQVSKVGRAHRQHQLVGGEVVLAARQRHVDELLLMTQILGQLEKRFMMIVPFEQKLLFEVARVDVVVVLLHGLRGRHGRGLRMRFGRLLFLGLTRRDFGRRRGNHDFGARFLRLDLGGRRGRRRRWRFRWRRRRGRNHSLRVLLHVVVGGRRRRRQRRLLRGRRRHLLLGLRRGRRRRGRRRSRRCGV